MFEQIGAIHPLLPSTVGLAALLAAAAVTNLIVSLLWRHKFEPAIHNTDAAPMLAKSFP